MSKAELDDANRRVDAWFTQKSVRRWKRTQVSRKDPSAASETLTMPHGLTTLSPTCEVFRFRRNENTCGFPLYPAGARSCSPLLIVSCSARHRPVDRPTPRSVSERGSQLSRIVLAADALGNILPSLRNFRSSADTNTSTLKITTPPLSPYWRELLHEKVLAWTVAFAAATSKRQQAPSMKLGTPPQNPWS